MPRTQIFPDRSDNYRSSTTDQQNRQLFSTRRPYHRPQWQTATTTEVDCLYSLGVTSALFEQSLCVFDSIDRGT